MSRDAFIDTRRRDDDEKSRRSRIERINGHHQSRSSPARFVAPNRVKVDKPDISSQRG